LLDLAGLLARNTVQQPSHFKVALKFKLFPKLSASGGLGASYSYGDSAGLTPDFPFNRSILQLNKEPNRQQM